MQRYIAFLSGLPVGRNAVGMSTIKNLFNRLGFLNVETYLTTGNVSFETTPVGLVAPLESQISRHISRWVGGDVRTFIRTPEEIAGITANVPFPPEEGVSLFVILLSEPLDDKVARRLTRRHNEAEELYPAGREVYWLRRPTDDEMPPPPLVDVLDTPATVRSLNTLKHFAGDTARRPATASELFRR
jgi:uncharacterized protein (DUF1697 family)